MRARLTICLLSLAAAWAGISCLAPGANAGTPRTFFGVVADLSSKGDAGRMKKAHVGSLRIGMYWPAIQPTHGGSYDWSAVDNAVALGMPAARLRPNFAIARGLDYYTGTIYETTLDDKPDIGSVCSGGRYDNLAGLYTKQALPGVGASLGLDRLLAAMEELHMLSATTTPAPVLIVQFAADQLGAYQKMGRALRAQGIGVEVFPEAKKLGQQLQYAERRGFRVAFLRLYRSIP